MLFLMSKEWNNSIDIFVNASFLAEAMWRLKVIQKDKHEPAAGATFMMSRISTE